MANKPWGVFQPGAPSDMSKITSFVSLAGAQPQYIQWFNNFAGNNIAYVASNFTNVLNYGAIPVLTWEPSDNTGAVHISNADVVNGTYDTIIDSYANGIKALSGTVYIRLGHEPNGNWYDWAPGNNGNTYASYVSMWQHVRGRFNLAGCTNVKWVWCLNVHYTGEANPLWSSLYPGDSYVDFLSLDGYNPGDDHQGHVWNTFTQKFSSSITDIVAVTPNRPFGINEFGCVEQGGKSKAAWIQDAIFQINNDSRITYWLYFNNTGSGYDNRITTSTDATLAFASSLVTQTSFSRFMAHV